MHDPQSLAPGERERGLDPGGERHVADAERLGDPTVAIDQEHRFEAGEELVVADVFDADFRDGEVVARRGAGGGERHLEFGGAAGLENVIAVRRAVDFGEEPSGGVRGFGADDKAAGRTLHEGFFEGVGFVGHGVERVADSPRLEV